MIRCLNTSSTTLLHLQLPPISDSAILNQSDSKITYSLIRASIICVISLLVMGVPSKDCLVTDFAVTSWTLSTL